MAGNCIVAIGGSAGGIESLVELIAHLPADLPAALFVVIHFPPDSVSYLADILNRKGRIPAHLAQDGEAIENGRIIVSVPDYHLRIERDGVRLTHDARENHNRPAIDVMFRSAAAAYGPDVIGIVLSGLLHDGTVGLIEIKRCGGTAIVQDPATAHFGDMPQSVINRLPDIDAILPPREIAAYVVQLIAERKWAPTGTRIQEQESHLEMAHKRVSDEMSLQ
jgi:two-component system chemotaxis response regulator CheB